MQFRAGLLFVLATLTCAAPAAAQPEDRLANVGKWVTSFAEAMSEPNLASASCAPQMQQAISRAHDAASARAALADVKPCTERVRSAYARAIVKLDALESLPAGAGTTGFSFQKFIAEQRKLAAESIAQVDRVQRLLDAIIANNRSALPRLANDVRQGGALLLDSNILMFRLQKEIAQFQSSRQIADLRILLAEAGKALMTSPATSNGIAAGGRLSDLAARAREMRPNLLNAWSVDKARLRPSDGSGGEPTAERVIANLEPMIAGVATDSDRLASALAKTGSKPVLSLTEATRLAADLQSIELQLQTRAKAFASALAADK